MKKFISYYAVLENKDQMEGRGPLVELDIAFTSAKAAANFIESDYYTQHHAVMGVQQNAKEDSYLIELKNICIVDTVEEALSINKEEEIKKALNKLSSREIGLLGLVGFKSTYS